MNINSVFHIGMNVMNMDRSVAFYRKLGFEVIQDVLMSAEDSRDTSACFGSEPSGGRVVFLRHGTDPKGLVFDLVQWDKPQPRQNPGDGYRATGIGRVCLTAEKPEEVLVMMKAEGIEPLGPLATSELPAGGQYSVFAFHDPDGTIVEVISASVARSFQG